MPHPTPASSYDAPAPAATAVPPRTSRGVIRPRAVAIGAVEPRLAAALVVTLWLLWNGSSVPADLPRWISGTATVLGIALVLAILSRSVAALWPAALLALARDRIMERPARSVLALGLASWMLYVAVSHLVFDATPLNLDEVAQHVQARIFAGGALWTPAPSHPEFFSIYHVVDVGGRVYGQFPPGGPAMLALGELAGASWLIVPLAGAIAVAAWCAVLRVAEPRSGAAIGAALLFALSPFFVFLAGTSMNHVSALMWILVAVAALVHATREAAPRPMLAIASGVAFGMAGTIRPADALAFALPAAIWLVARTIGDRSRWRELAAAGVGVALPLAIMALVNASTTGAPFRFGYEVLWGKAHGIGFHVDPSGVMHTPGRGLARVGDYLRALQTHLFELPAPSLLPALLALALGRRASAIDRYLLASAGLLLFLYAAYWFDGQYLGPRFLLPLAPVLALWTARLPALVRERGGDGFALRATSYALVVALAMGAVLLIPARSRIYAAASPEMRWDADSAAAAAGVRGAIVLVRESWGAQILARMHALGVSRSEASRIYRRTDSCLLDERVASLETRGVRGDAATTELAPLVGDSSRVIPSPFSPRTAERVLPGTVYGARCLERIAQDRAGFTTLVPFALARENIYARDLQERNALLLARHPERPVYLVKPESEAPGARLAFLPLSRDSLMRLGAAVAR